MKKIPVFMLVLLICGTAFGGTYDVYWVCNEAQGYWDVASNWQDAPDSSGWGIPGMVADGEAWNSNKGFARIEDGCAVVNQYHQPNGRVERVYVGSTDGSSMLFESGELGCYKFYTSEMAGESSTYRQTGGNFECYGYTYLGHGANSNSVLDLLGGTFKTDNYVYCPNVAADGSNVTINVDGAYVTIGSNIYLAQQANTVTTLNLKSGVIEHGGSNFCMGLRGQTYFNVEGGSFITNATDKIRVGWYAGAYTNLNLSSGRFIANKEFALHRGTLSVNGSGMSEIKLAKLVCVDGNEETLEFNLDENGITPIVVTGADGADLDDCTLAVDVLDGFNPSAGQEIPVLYASQILIDDELNLNNLDENYIFSYVIREDPTYGYSLNLKVGGLYTWAGNDGFWNVGNNWIEGVVPTQVDDAFVDGGVLSLPASETKINELSLNDCRLNISNNILSVASNLNAGTLANQKVEIYQDSGELNVGGDLKLARTTEDYAETDYFISGGDLSVGGYLFVGSFNCDGTYVQTGGNALINNAVRCGYDAGYGIIEISGGSFVTNNYMTVRDGEFRVLGSNIQSIEINRLDLQDEPDSSLVIGLDENGVTPITITNSYAKFVGAKLRIEALPGYKGNLGDTFDIIKIANDQTLVFEDTTIESIIPQEFSVNIVDDGVYKILQLKVESYGIPRTVFRYRSYEGDKPEPVSETTGNVDHSVNSGDIVEVDRGYGFENSYYTSFDGVSNYIAGNDPVSTLLMPEDSADIADNTDSFTVNAWFKADTVAGERCLVSNLNDDSGFALKITEGQLCGVVNLSDSGALDCVSVSGVAVESGRWYHAAFVVERKSFGYELKLYLDEKEAAVFNAEGFDRVVQSSAVPVLGCQIASSGTKDAFFDGSIQALTIKNYAMHPDCLKFKQAKDSGFYFGLPHFHDYLTATKGWDLRYIQSLVQYPDMKEYVSKEFFIPLMDDCYVPQGVTTNGIDTVYVACFWYNTDNEKGRYTSVIIEMTTDGRLKKVMPLFESNGWDFARHCGGLAYYNGYIYVNSNDDIFKFKLSEGSSNDYNAETFENGQHDANPLYVESVLANFNVYPNERISLLAISDDYDGTPIFWTAQYSADAYDYIIGFEVFPDGTVDKQNQRYVFHMPCTRGQGIYCYYASADELRFYISTSSGAYPSKLYDVHYKKGQVEPIYYGVAVEGPSGFEDLGMIGNELWTVAESGTKCFQKRIEDRWTDFYPCVFALNFNRGDLNGDGRVNEADLFLMIDRWLDEADGMNEDICPKNGDGRVDLLDLSVFANGFIRDN